MASFNQLRREQKERAFAQWVASGYRDFSAWNEYIRLFVELQSTQNLFAANIGATYER